MIMQIVRFRSGMSEDEVLRTYEERAPRYRAIEALRQKLYLRFPESGEHGAVYLWESEEALAQFHQSELYRTIPSAYDVQGDPDIRTAEVVLTLRPDRQQGRP